MSLFYCCSGADTSYQRVKANGANTDQKRADETIGYFDEKEDNFDDLANQADLHIAEPEPVLQAVEEKEIHIDVIHDDDDNDDTAPIESWGTRRVLNTLKSIPNGAEKKKREQARIAKLVKRLVELCEAKDPALKILGDQGLNLLLGFLPRMAGLNAIQSSICHCIQFLCARPEADEFPFPEESGGARRLLDVVVEHKQHTSTLIAALDCLSVFARVSSKYVQSSIDAGVVPLTYELVAENMGRGEGFPLQIALTRVVSSIARSPEGRAALGDEGVKVLLDSMNKFKEIQNIIANCLEGMWYLCQDADNCILALEDNITAMLTDTMQNRFVGQDLHTKVITLLHQIVSQDGLPSRFVSDPSGVNLICDLLVDNTTVSENYVIIMQVWITLLAHASEETRSQLVNNTFVTQRLPKLGPVIASDRQAARESALTLLLIVLQIYPRALDTMINDQVMMNGILNAPNLPVSADGIQCLMVIYFKLTGSFDQQSILFEGGILSFLASDWYRAPNTRVETVKSASAALVRLYSNPSYHQELHDKVANLRRLVEQRNKFPEAREVLGELEAALDRVGAASSVYVTVQREAEYKFGEGEGGTSAINVKLSVGQGVEVFSKSQKRWLPGRLRDIADGRVCVVYSNREKWLKQTSQQWRPLTDQIEQASRTRTGTTLRRPPRIVEEKQGDDEEASQDYAGEPGAATEFEQPYIPEVNVTVDAADIISRTADRRLGSPMPHDSKLTRPATKRQTTALESEMDFDVTFPDKKLGLELRPGDRNNNCVVSRCLSDFTQERIDPESFIIQVNGHWVKDLPFDTIYQIIVTATKNPPLTIMFRTPKDASDEAFLEELSSTGQPGTLKVHVVEALQLQTRGRYAKVKITGNKIQTTIVAPSENPAWPDTLEFGNFTPNHGLTGTVSVYSQNRLLKDNKIGSAKFDLPSIFYRLERHQLELLDKKDKLTGTVSVTAILTQNVDRESHMLRASMPLGS